MEICSALSGQTLAVLEGEEFEGKSAKEVKQLLATNIGVSRFRQKLIWENDSCTILDDEIFTDPVKVLLVVLEFWPPNAVADRSMILASRENDSTILKKLLESPRNPSVTDERCETPLHHAARRGHLRHAELLLEAGADKDAQSGNWLTPLHVAVQQGHLEVVRLLIDAGADTNLADQNGEAALHYAAAGRHVEVVRLLIDAGADKNQSDRLGYTALYCATMRNHFEVARLLIKAGADKNLMFKSRSVA